MEPESNCWQVQKEKNRHAAPVRVEAATHLLDKLGRVPESKENRGNQA